MPYCQPYGSQFLYFLINMKFSFFGRLEYKGPKENTKNTTAVLSAPENSDRLFL